MTTHPETDVAACQFGNKSQNMAYLGLAATVKFSVKDVFGVQSMKKLSYLSAEV